MLNRLNHVIRPLMNKDKFPELVPTPEDEQKMESLVGKAKEIVGEDERKMETLIGDAKEILERAAQEKREGKNAEALADLNSLDEEDFLEDDDREYLETLLKELKERMFDEKSNFYTNVERGSLNEVYYRTLVEEAPELGLSINETAETMDGEILKNRIAVEATPYKTDREFIFRLSNNPLIHALKYPDLVDKDKAEKLEEEGVLPKGIHDRALARRYKDYFERFNNKKWQELMFKLGVEPLSDEEARELMSGVIKEEYKKRF